MRKLEDLTCHQILKLSNALFYGGMGLLVVALLVSSGDFAPPVLVALPVAAGAALIVAGLVLAFWKLRCPYCGESLCLGGRLPTSLPRHCPGCGKEL